MNRLAYRRATGIAGTMLLLMSLLVAVGLPAVANVQDNGTQSANCGGEWHWIHNQTNATSGTLTAVFASAGPISVPNSESPSGNLHYHINLAAGDTLISASDSVNDDGKLVLSHWPTCGGTTTSTTAATTTTPSTTSTTAGTSPTQVSTTSTIPFDSVPGETEVLGIQVSAPAAQVAPAQVATQETLPFTGVSTSSMALLAIAFAGIGVLLLMASRKAEERTPVRNWN